MLGLAILFFKPWLSSLSGSDVGVGVCELI